MDEKANNRQRDDQNVSITTCLQTKLLLQRPNNLINEPGHISSHVLTITNIYFVLTLFCSTMLLCKR